MKVYLYERILQLVAHSNNSASKIKH